MDNLQCSARQISKQMTQRQTDEHDHMTMQMAEFDMCVTKGDLTFKTDKT